MAKIIFSMTKPQAQALIKFKAGKVARYSLDNRTMHSLTTIGLISGDGWNETTAKLTPKGRAAAQIAKIMGVETKGKALVRP